MSEAITVDPYVLPQAWKSVEPNQVRSVHTLHVYVDIVDGEPHFITFDVAFTPENASLSMINKIMEIVGPETDIEKFPDELTLGTNFTFISHYETFDHKIHETLEYDYYKSVL